MKKPTDSSTSPKKVKPMISSEQVRTLLDEVNQPTSDSLEAALAALCDDQAAPKDRVIIPFYDAQSPSRPIEETNPQVRAEYEQRLSQYLAGKIRAALAAQQTIGFQTFSLPEDPKLDLKVKDFRRRILSAATELAEDRYLSELKELNKLDNITKERITQQITAVNQEIDALYPIEDVE